MQMVRKRDADDPVRRWGFVFAIARTWKTVEDKAIKDLVTHLPRNYYQRVRVPRHLVHNQATFLGMTRCASCSHP